MSAANVKSLGEELFHVDRGVWWALVQIRPLVAHVDPAAKARGAMGLEMVLVELYAITELLQGVGRRISVLEAYVRTHFIDYADVTQEASKVRLRELVIKEGEIDEDNEVNEEQSDLAKYMDECLGNLRSALRRLSELAPRKPKRPAHTRPAKVARELRALVRVLDDASGRLELLLDLVRKEDKQHGATATSRALIVAADSLARPEDRRLS